ncbi:hypothetical protein C3L33_10785, partial [Rhododendron williamsianum]
MEDVGFMNHWPINCLNDILNHPISPQIVGVKPNSMEYSSHARNTWNSSGNSSSTHQISFSNPNYETQSATIKPKEKAVPAGNITTLPSGVLNFQGSLGNPISGFKACQGSKRNCTNSKRVSSSQEHVLSERKRREKISQRIIALSAMVPGLKKMDKASVIGDAIDYMKQLQEQVKTLEEQASKTISMGSVVYLRKCELHSDHWDNLSLENSNYTGGGGNSGAHYDEPLPEIGARSCDKNVLIRIHCVKRKGVVEKTVAEIEKLHLSVVSSNVMAFGSYALDMTILAQV